MPVGLRSVSAKAIALVILFIVISIVASTGFLLRHFSGILGADRLNSDIAAAELLFNPQHEAYRIADGKLYAGSRLLSGDNEIADRIGKVFGSTDAIFQNNVRVATNVRLTGGKRAIGTTLPPDIARIVLGEGKPYTGRMSAAGTPVIAAFIPLKDAGGTPVGALGIGFVWEQFNKTFSDAMKLACIAGLGLIVLCALLALLCFRRLLSPFAGLGEVMEETKAGHYREDVPYTEREDEFGALARVIKAFNRSMRKQKAHEAERQQAEAKAAEAKEQAEAEARSRNEQLVVSTFGEGLKALAEGNLDYRLHGDLPVAYRVLQDDFNQAIASFEAHQTAFREAADQREAERRDAEVRHRQAEEASVTRSMELVVSTFGEGLRALAKNDLTCRIEAELPEGYRQLKDDYNASLEHLDQMMRDIDIRADEIADNTQQIRDASQEMAQRTERQAASLEETAAAMEEVTENVRKSAENAGEASKSASAAHMGAQKGNEVTKNTIEAMREIAKSSVEITQIISVIDEIAFQTNLLALNAGVEAARAGDAGRGFAVVASEVRTLAQRSADAAKQIKALISTSEHQVEHGVTLVEESGHALENIVTDVARINALMAEIATAQREQATALDEINAAISDMDHTTQQNAAMAEESTAASRAVADHARELAAMMDSFKTQTGDSASVRTDVADDAATTAAA